MEVGFVTDIHNFLIHADGLPTIRVNDLVEAEGGATGWVNALYPDQVEVLVLNNTPVRQGEILRHSDKRLSLTVGQFLLGRAINSLGEPVDGKGFLSRTKTDEVCPIHQQARGISMRQFITNQLDTGITVLDTLLPIAKGQRELMLADAHSGKLDFLINLIVNQKKSGVICIYASIGKPLTEVRSLIDALRSNRALEHTVIVASSSSDSSPLVFLTPLSAMAIAEYFQKRGKDVLVILDDMGIHAKIYREIALLGNRSPGRESYPGDLFFHQANILERAGSFSPDEGGGSITALPIMELSLNDFTSYISTNLMAATDGHLMIKSAFYKEGRYPAIDILFSVSRVGRQTQNRIQISVANKIKEVISRSEQLATVSRFATELPPLIQKILKQKKVLDNFLWQNPLTSIPKQIQIVLLALVFTSLLDQNDPEFLIKNKQNIIKNLYTDPSLLGFTKNVFQLKNEREFWSKLEETCKRVQLLCKP